MDKKPPFSRSNTDFLETDGLCSCGEHQMKYLVVTGGTMSGLGKGTTISSIGVTLKALGLRVTAIKIDPYLNVDAGTMSPYEHGEVFVLEDGGEVDLDLGNYERFLEITLSSAHNLTSGKVFQKVICRERAGDYLGRTVQLVPQVTDAVQNWLARVASLSVDRSGVPADICLVEVGGTVGDIESAMYLEALQQFRRKVKKDNFCLCHVSYVPTMQGDQKTKPTQHGVKELRMAGLSPDLIFCRCETMLSDASRAKIALFTQVLPENVISVHDVSNTYRVPEVLEKQGVARSICELLQMTPRVTDGKFLRKWTLMASRLSPEKPHAETVKIGIVGKYTGLSDSYLSVVKALQHGAMEANVELQLVWIESSNLEKATAEASAEGKQKYSAAWEALHSVDGVVCPGGFGDRGINGKASSANYCRESRTPYLGICLGMQTAVIEFARDVLEWRDANSEEFDPQTSCPVVILMPEHSGGDVGGTMRLGKRATIIRDVHSLVAKLYDLQPVVDERHRHRYEVNLQYVKAMEARGLKFVGQNECGTRMEIAELKDHPFYICVQFHPEFTSRPLKPSPLFLGLVLAAAGQLEGRLKRFGGKLCSGAAYEEHDRS